ncbi:MAG TPA: hypothetical protein VHU84_12440 [Lacipirellulaceae bacterium]|jgi:hypothetical protein|nr:hypothetical protein [Lacipirellulaceae bacterium]
MRHYLSLRVICLTALTFLAISLSVPAAPEIEPLDIAPATADKPITLRDRLVAGLQARLKSEVDFCDEVAALVQIGVLPQQLVDETFFWARQRAASIRNGHKYRPIVYFQPGMRARADKLRITL